MSICGLNDSSNTLLLNSDNIEITGNVIAKNIISNFTANNVDIEGNLNVKLNYAELVQTILPNNTTVDMSASGWKIRINKKGTRLAVSGLDPASYNLFVDQDNGKLSDGTTNAPQGKLDRGFVKTFVLNENGTISHQYGQDLSENYGFGRCSLDIDEDGNTLVVGMPSKRIHEDIANVNSGELLQKPVDDYNEGNQCGQFNIYHYNSNTDYWDLVDNSPQTGFQSAGFYKYSFRGYGNTHHINDFTIDSTVYVGVGDRYLETWMRNIGIGILYTLYGLNVKISANGNKIIVSAPLSRTYSQAASIGTWSAASPRVGYFEVFEKSIIPPNNDISWNLVYRYLPSYYSRFEGISQLSSNINGKFMGSDLDIYDGGIALNFDGSKLAVTARGNTDDTTTDTAYITKNEGRGYGLLFVENDPNDPSYNDIYYRYLLKDFHIANTQETWFNSSSNNKLADYGAHSLNFDYYGNKLITGYYFYTNYNDGGGFVEIYNTTNNHYSLDKIILGNRYEKFGVSTAISDDGTRIAALLQNNNATKIFIKIYDYINGDWVLNFNVIVIDYDTTWGDHFKGNITLSGDGKILIYAEKWDYTDKNNDNSKIYIYNLTKKKFNMLQFCIDMNKKFLDTTSNNY